MQVLMDDFSYYFSVDGREGGLFSATFEFALNSGGGEEQENAAVKALIETHTEVIDRLFATVLKGERIPLMTDTPGLKSSGYRYSGSLRGKMGFARKLAAVFGDVPFDFRGSRGSRAGRFMTYGIEIELSASKRASSLQRPTVSIKYKLGHTMNVCFFNFTRGLPGMDVSEEARRSIDELDKVLAQDWEREGRDHFQALIGSSRPRTTH